MRSVGDTVCDNTVCDAVGRVHGGPRRVDSRPRVRPSTNIPTLLMAFFAPLDGSGDGDDAEVAGGPRDSALRRARGRPPATHERVALRY